MLIDTAALREAYAGHRRSVLINAMPAVLDELDAARAALAEYEEPTLQDLHYDNTGLRFGTSTIRQDGLIARMAATLTHEMLELGAENFVEQEIVIQPNLEAQVDQDARKVIITFQWAGKETPPEQRVRLRAELDAARARIAELEAAEARRSRDTETADMETLHGLTEILVNAGYKVDMFHDALCELRKARARIVELERIVDAAREAAACAGDCVMTVAGCQTHNWDDPCAMAELRAAMRGKDGE